MGGGIGNAIEYNEIMGDSNGGIKGELFNQIFGVKYVPYIPVKTPPNPAPKNFPVVYRSGNPGYMTNTDLIVG